MASDHLETSLALAANESIKKELLYQGRQFRYVSAYIEINRELFTYNGDETQIYQITGQKAT